MGFSSQDYWSGLPFPSPGDLSDPGIERGSPTLPANALPSEPPGKPHSVSKHSQTFFVGYIFTFNSSFFKLIFIAKYTLTFEKLILHHQHDSEINYLNSSPKQYINISSTLEMSFVTVDLLPSSLNEHFGK